MNLFYLDHDLDKCAEYHVDSHVGKMQLEATQLLTTALWVDKLLGFIPRKLTSEELKVINDAKSKEPSINERTFTRYLPTHINHPCAIWVRSSLDNYIWTLTYVNALCDESMWRCNKRHASCIEANRMPDPNNLPSTGLTKIALAMPDEYKTEDPVESYRNYYKSGKAHLAVWKLRGKPSWWE